MNAEGHTGAAFVCAFFSGLASHELFFAFA
jgi:hypothetical protein